MANEATVDQIVNIFSDIISSPQFIQAKSSCNGALREIAGRLDTDLDYFTYRID